MPRDRIVVHEAVAAVDLGTVAGVVHGSFAGEEFGDGGLLLERFTGKHQRGRVVIGSAGRVRPSLHPGDLELDRLEPPDRLTERRPIARVLHTLVHASLRRPGRQCGDGDASLVEDLQEVRVASAAFAEQVLLGNPDVGKRQRMRVGRVPTNLVVGRFNGETRRRHLNHDR